MSDNAWPRDIFRQAMWDCPNLSASERALLQVYAEYARDGVEAWVVSAEMTRRSGIRSRSTIERTAKSAVRKGWLVQVRPATMHRAAVYRIAIPADCEDDRHTALCPNLTHKGLRLLVSKSDAQALVSKSDDGLVSKSDAQSVPDQFTNHPGVAEAVVLVSGRLGIGLDEARTWYGQKAARASGPVVNPVRFAEKCLAIEAADPWAAQSRDPRPVIGTRGDPACPDCHGSGLAEDDDGRPTGRPCRRCAA